MQILDFITLINSQNAIARSCGSCLLFSLRWKSSRLSPLSIKFAGVLSYVIFIKLKKSASIPIILLRGFIMNELDFLK